MKIFKQVIAITIAVVGVFAGFKPAEEELIVNDKIFASLEKISINKLLDLEQIVVSVEDDLERARLYQITAFEVDGKMADDNLNEKLKLHVGSNQPSGVMIFVAEKNN